MIDTQYYVILGIYRGFIIYQETAVIGQFCFILGESEMSARFVLWLAVRALCSQKKILPDGAQWNTFVTECCYVICLNNGNKM